MIETISSRQNPRVKELISLKDRKGRDREGLFVVEGLEEIQRAAQQYELAVIYFAPDLETPPETVWREAQQQKGSAVIPFAPHLIEACAYRENPSGLLVVFKYQEHSLKDCRAKTPSLVLLLAGLEKPGNIGAIARSARAAGVDLLGFTDPRTDLFNPNVIRASRGHWFHLEKAVGTPEEWSTYFKDQGILPVRTLVDSGTNLWEHDWVPPTALILGEEHAGLEDFWAALAPAAVTIPMDPAVDSLNVSVSAALLLYEIKRQRK
jgi:TrmH family RNA methyltransferase